MIAFYADENVEGAIVRELRGRGVDIVTAEEDGYAHTADRLILDRASELGRVVFSRDQDFLRDAKRRQAIGLGFAGVVFARKRIVSIGECIYNLEVMAVAGMAGDFEDTVWFLPL
jgi:hypothetical protein